MPQLEKNTFSKLHNNNYFFSSNAAGVKYGGIYLLGHIFASKGNYMIKVRAYLNAVCLKKFNRLESPFLFGSFFWQVCGCSAKGHPWTPDLSFLFF